MNSPDRRFASIDFLWLGLMLFIILAIAVLLPIYPNDYWWYVRLGRDIVANQAIPLADTFTYSQAGEPVVYLAWLSAVIFWGLHHLGGSALTIFSKGLAIAAFYGLVWSTCRSAGAGPKLAFSLGLISALAASNNWVLRPQVLAYPLFGFALWLMYRQKKRALWLLPLVGLVWVNLHGSFPLLFLLVGFGWLGEWVRQSVMPWLARRGFGGWRQAEEPGRVTPRQLAAVLALIILASMLNPLGWRVLADALNIIGDPANQQFSTEWRPPVNAGWQGHLFFGWILAFPLIIKVSPNRLKLTEWLWFFGFGWMALSGLRYVVWFLAVLAVLSARLLAPFLNPLLDKPPRKVQPALNMLIAAVFMLLPLLGLPGVRERWFPKSPPVYSLNTPVAAVDWLASHPELPGPLWTEFSFASYVEYALPGRPVWIDTRFEVFPAEQWEHYLAISQAAADWQERLDGTGSALLLVSVVDQARLLAALQQSPQWCERFLDGTAGVFTRSELDPTCQRP